MPRSLRFHRTDDGAKDDGVGCVTHRFHLSWPMGAFQRSKNQGSTTRNRLSYPKLGMQLGRKWEMPWFGTEFAADYGQLSLPKHQTLHQGSISSVSRMIELHGYHMTSYTMICEAHLPQHRARARGYQVTADPVRMITSGRVR